jgi:hypothetical protein
MQLRYIALVLTTVILIMPSPAFAQDSEQDSANGLTDNLEEDIVPVIEDVEGLRLKLVEHSQEPDTKEIVFDIVIYSQIRSDRVQLNWSIDGVSTLESEGNQLSFRVDPGTVKKVRIVVKPRDRGVSNLRIRVEAFEVEGTYLATAFQRVYSLEDGTRLPRTDTYRFNQVVAMVRGVAQFLLYLFGFLLVASAGYGVFRRWLDLKEAQLEVA